MNPTFFTMLEDFDHPILADRGRVDSALRSLRARACSENDDTVPERRAQLVSLFVRQLPGVSVDDAYALERAMLQHVGAVSVDEFRVEVKTSVDVITLRAHVRRLTMGTVMDWEGAQRLQALAANVARAIRQEGVPLRCRGAVLGERILLSYVVPTPEDLERPSVAAALSSMRGSCVGYRVVRSDEGAVARVGCDAVSIVRRISRGVDA